MARFRGEVAGPETSASRTAQDHLKVKVQTKHGDVVLTVWAPDKSDTTRDMIEIELRDNGGAARDDVLFNGRVLDLMKAERRKAAIMVLAGEFLGGVE